jgi:antitoxin (DNA-binding transcriptional repressor) of toxin-antitoxin stability system
VKKVNIYEAKTGLSRLVEEAASGRDIVIARAGRPVARLTRLAGTGGKRRLGVLAELPVSGAHAERLAGLPLIHKGPFDRMLVAQSLAEPLALLTNDGVLADYGDVVKVV